MAAEEDEKSMTYQEIETDIYGDTNAFNATSDYALKFRLKGKDDASDDEDISMPAPPPPAPRRQPNSKDAYKERPPAPLPEEDDKPSVPPRHTKGDTSSKPAKDTGQRNEQRAERGQRNGQRRRESDEAVARVHKELSESLSNSHSRGNKRGKENNPASSRRAEVTVDPDEVDEDEEDSDDYWKNIYYEGEEKERAQEIIRNIGEDGVYLVRTGADGGQVLVVYAENMPKKYKITNENGEYYLKKDGPHCDSVEMLMYTYYNTELPTAKSYLETPFKLHPKYKG